MLTALLHNLQRQSALLTGDQSADAGTWGLMGKELTDAVVRLTADGARAAGKVVPPTGGKVSSSLETCTAWW